MLTAAEVYADIYQWISDEDITWNDLADVKIQILALPGTWEVMPSDVRRGQEMREVVLRWTQNDGHERYFRKGGCYTSFAGYEWDGPFMEVFPREVVKTEWVPV